MIALCIPSCGNEAAPAEITFTYFDGTEGSLADFRGKPLVINFWASWCAPCIVEMPSLEVVWNELQDKVVFLGLNVHDNRADAIAMIERTGVTYLLGQDVNDAFHSLGGVSMPTTVLVNSTGEISAVRGARMRANELRSLIRKSFPAIYPDTPAERAMPASATAREFPAVETITP